MLILIYSILIGLFGLIVVAVNLSPRHHIAAIAVLVILTTIWFYHAGILGLYYSTKVVLFYGCLVAASMRPKLILLTLGIVVCLNDILEIYISTFTKLTSLPSVGLLLLACATYSRFRLSANALIILGLILAILNFIIVQYRSEMVLVASIGFCIFAFTLKWYALGSTIVFLPIIVSAIYFIIGAQFSISPDVALLYTFSVEATESNFERSLFSYGILSSLIDYPIGRSMQEATYDLRYLAYAVERTFYEAPELDPHNFFLFFSSNFGFIGSLAFIFWIWQTFNRIVYSFPESNLTIKATLISIAGIEMSLFPFSTEPRTIAAACIGAALCKSFHYSATTDQLCTKKPNLT